MRKLTIVVTCVDGKTQIPAEHLKARTLPLTSVQDRSDTWRARLGRPVTEQPLMGLYKGDAWTQVGKLVADAREAGFRPRLLIASAGLGLRDAAGIGPAYAATFAGGQPDTVATSRVDTRLWWSALAASRSALTPSEVLRGSVLLVLSEPYAIAMHHDLVALGRRGDDLLLVGGSCDIAGVPRLPADLRLRERLGGTATSLNLRTAREWLTRARGTQLHSATDQTRWNRWAAQVRRPLVKQRQTLSDETGMQMIREIRTAEPSISCTRALRMLRDSGWACEQKRFGTLFRTESMSR